MSADNWAGLSMPIAGPAERHYTVTPSPDVLDPIPRALRILTDGTVTVEDVAGTAVTYPVVAGDQLNFRARKVTAATATVVAWL